jgi:hypothetical protein
MFKLCAPALIYLCFSIIQIVLDMFKELYQEALFKLVALIIITLMLNILCEQNLELVAWIIVLVPFILMTEMIIMLVYIFGVNTYNGTIDYKKDENEDEDKDEETKVSYVFVKTPPQGSSSPAYS